MLIGTLIAFLIFGMLAVFCGPKHIPSLDDEGFDWSELGNH